ncbi:HAD family hydrolase [Longispora albida]|uniref:HAD family hydrolase n=1 Tax=Longispora albida TaxID=203523 RepID=UPI0003778689|nr:HAD family phosphatase [Longispora albida]
MTSGPDVAELISGHGPLLLDFDGPVCSVFAGYPAPKVAAVLREVLHAERVDVSAVETESDPLEVLRWTQRQGTARLTRAVEDALCAAEVQAVRTAEPTPYGREVIVAARQARKPVAIVSNNSEAAIAAYLTAHRLIGHFAAIIGRAYAAPDRMKPSPAPLLNAARALQSEPSTCLLIGDTVTDVESGIAAGVPVLGYANKPRKIHALNQAGAAHTVTSMRPVAVVLLELAEAQR